MPESIASSSRQPLHPALSFLLKLYEEEDAYFFSVLPMPQYFKHKMLHLAKNWERLLGKIRLSETLRAEFLLLTPSTTLDDLNTQLLQIIQQPEFKTYLNSKLKCDAKMFLFNYLILTVFGAACIAEFTFNNSLTHTKDNVYTLYGITLPETVLIVLGSISVVVNGFFVAALFKECTEQLYAFVKRIRRIVVSDILPIFKIFGVTSWTLFEALIYTYGFFSAVGDYEQARGIGQVSFLLTVVVSCLNGFISGYGVKEPLVDFIDYLKIHTVSSLSTKENNRNFWKTLCLTVLAYIGIAPPAFLAQNYENGSRALMTITQSATISAAFLFAYKVIVKDSIPWPENYAQKIVVGVAFSICCLSGINMLGALTMLQVAHPAHSQLVMGFLSVLVFFCAGFYNGIASVPLSVKMFADIQLVLNRDPALGYRQLQSLLAVNYRPELRRSRIVLDAKLAEHTIHESTASSLSQRITNSCCCPPPDRSQEYQRLQPDF